jgi:hypothetical protein
MISVWGLLLIGVDGFDFEVERLLAGFKDFLAAPEEGDIGLYSADVIP